jgi:alpha-L-rhamnosidase
MSTPVTPNDFPEIRWRGHWIWAEPPAISSSPFSGTDDEVRAQAHGLFRKSFTLERVPERAPARITADSRYLLFVNGQ